MFKRAIKIFGLISIWIGLGQSAAFACSCARLASPNEYLQISDVVFAGKVIDENKVGWWSSWIRFKRHPPFIERTEAFYQSRTVFEVTAVWKGDVFAKTSVIHGLIGASCGYVFDQGEEYIVYAYRVEGELHTHRCLRNNKLSDASEDLAAFGAGKTPASNPSSVANYIGKLIAVFLLLSVLSLAGWQARRKYGVQKS